MVTWMHLPETSFSLPMGNYSKPSDAKADKHPGALETACSDFLLRGGVGCVNGQVIGSLFSWERHSASKVLLFRCMACTRGPAPSRADVVRKGSSINPPLNVHNSVLPFIPSNRQKNSPSFVNTHIKACNKEQGGGNVTMLSTVCLFWQQRQYFCSPKISLEHPLHKTEKETGSMSPFSRTSLEKEKRLLHFSALLLLCGLHLSPASQQILLFRLAFISFN